MQLDENLDFLRAGSVGIPRAIGVDSSNAVWVTGLSGGGLGDQDIFLVKLTANGTGFNTAVAQTYSGAGLNVVYGLTVDPNDNVLIAGGFQFDVDFDVAPDRAFTLVSNGSMDAVLLKVASDGSFRWARSVRRLRHRHLHRCCTPTCMATCTRSVLLKIPSTWIQWTAPISSPHRRRPICGVLP